MIIAQLDNVGDVVAVVLAQGCGAPKIVSPSLSLQSIAKKAEEAGHHYHDC